MSDLGDDVMVLRHPMVRKGGRRLAVLLALGPIVLALLVMAGGFILDVPTRTGHLPLSAGLVMLGAYLASALFALPGLLMLRKERLTEELHVGSLGMELRQVRPGADGEPMICWRILWSDVAQAKLRYRGRDRTYEGVDIRTNSGMEQDLYVKDWEPVDGKSTADAVLRRAVLPVDADTIRHTSLVKALSAGGLQVEDDTPRPTDRLAAWLGLGLGAAAIIAALIFNYFVEH